MASTNKTSLGLNKWAASDKPVREDFNNDNVYINDKLVKLGNDLNQINNTLKFTSSATHFTQYPADMMDNNMISYRAVTQRGIKDEYAPSVPNTEATWFNVITFGHSSRCTQIACYSFLNHGANNKMWIRTQHDKTVSAWREV